MDVRVTLLDGLSAGNGAPEREATVRSKTVADVEEALRASSIVVQSERGARAAVLDQLAWLNEVRLRVRSIGSYQGPIEARVFAKITSRDLELLERACLTIDQAEAAEVEAAWQKATGGNAAPGETAASA